MTATAVNIDDKDAINGNDTIDDKLLQKRLDKAMFNRRLRGPRKTAPLVRLLPG